MKKVKTQRVARIGNQIRMPRRCSAAGPLFRRIRHAARSSASFFFAVGLALLRDGGAALPFLAATFDFPAGVLPAGLAAGLAEPRPRPPEVPTDSAAAGLDSVLGVSVLALSGFAAESTFDSELDDSSRSPPARLRLFPCRP